MATKVKAKEQPVEVTTSTRTKQIVLPDKMGMDEAIKWLQRRKTEEEQEVAVHESTDAYPLDGALALHKAMARRYGWTNLVPTSGFFGKSPPHMVGVRVGPGPADVVQVPWGRFEVPGIKGWLSTTIETQRGQPRFGLTGVVLRKHEKEINTLASEMREIIRAESIYRGKAITLRFPDEDASIDDYNPVFIDLQDVRPEELVFSADTMALVYHNLFVPIERAAACRKHQIPLKRGVLLAGPYGVGKTLSAYVAAKKCVENGWTFIYVEDIVNLAEALVFAQHYGPAMVFAEDIDRVVSERGDAANEILNVIDGVDSKAHEILICLTTNHVENISPALLRPGRLDAVISIGAPDADASERLVRQYGRGLIRSDEDLERVKEKLAGNIPAVLREVVERSKLAALGRITEAEELHITVADLCVAIDSMFHHLGLLTPKAPDVRTPVEKAAAIVASAMNGHAS